MKRMKYCGAVVLVILLATLVQAQSLADAARRQREAAAKAKPAKVWTNDDIPSVRASEPATTNEAAPAEGAAKDNAAKADDNKAAPAENKSAQTSAWKGKIDAQKAEIASLQRELDIAQREFKLQVANYYADAGNSLRDPKAWQEQSKKTQDDIAAKQAAIDTAKAKLSDLQEQARKAGVPASAIE